MSDRAIFGLPKISAKSTHEQSRTGTHQGKGEIVLLNEE
jgi:hypothetical protein